MKKAKMLICHRHLLEEYAERWAHYFDPTQIDDLHQLNLKEMKSELISIVEKIRHQHEVENFKMKKKLAECEKHNNHFIIKLLSIHHKIKRYIISLWRRNI